MLPGFHPAQDAFLLLRGQAGEVLQALQQLLLPRWRKFLKVRIFLKRLALLVGGQILVPAQPVTGMVPDNAFVANGFLLFFLRLALVVSFLPARPRHGALGKCRSDSQP